MRTFALFGAKYFKIFEIYVVFAQTKGVEPLRTYFGQGGRGVNFSGFVRTSFIDGPFRRFLFYILNVTRKNKLYLNFKWQQHT